MVKKIKNTKRREYAIAAIKVRPSTRERYAKDCPDGWTNDYFLNRLLGVYEAGLHPEQKNPFRPAASMTLKVKEERT